ncbi:MAG: T9SS type A sorting domain-containing protein, partial [Bacteroidales bacterium]|nr:T9SS type A sorting domain-containing protein [Bacteroidales bacterium]
SSYLTIVTGNANFGNLSQGETGNGTFTVTADINTPAGEPAEIDLDVTSNSGTYTNSYQMNFVIGQIPVVIIDLDENHNSGTAMQAAIQANEIAVEYTTSFPADLSIYTSAFVCLGIYSDNHVLSSSEGQALADFLNNGGNVYMEGGDTWYWDATTAVHSMFNINPEEDGTSDLGTINGMSATFTEGMSFNYSGDNNYIDHISAISPAFDIFENQSPNYGTGVAYDEGTYRTIGCSHEFGGLDDGVSPSTKEELMAEYLDFIGISTTLQALFGSNTTAICEGETVEFYDQSSGDVISWEWLFEGGAPGTSTFQNPTVMYFNAGSFYVTLIVSDGVNSDTLSVEDYITVNSVPEIPGTPLGDTAVCTNYGIISEYITTGSPNADSYVWDIQPAEAGTVEGSGTTGTVSWTDNWEGTATIRVKAINDCGESEFSEGFEVLCEICTGIKENNTLNFEIYPNPNNGLFTINFAANKLEKADIKVLNNLGKVVYETYDVQINNNTISINIKALDSGIYFIILTNRDNVVKEKIIIK